MPILKSIRQFLTPARPVEIDAAGTMTLSAGAGLQEGVGLQSLMDSGKVAVVTADCASWEDDCAEDYSATLKFTLPPWVRLGARYIGRDDEGDETYDVEVDLVYERWSVLDEYRIGFEGKLKAFNRLETLEAQKKELGVEDYSASQPTIEDIFLKIAGEKDLEAAARGTSARAAAPAPAPEVEAVEMMRPSGEMKVVVATPMPVDDPLTV